MKRELPDDGQISASGSSDFAAYDLARTASRRRHQRVGRDRAYASRGFAEEVGHAIAAWGDALSAATSHVVCSGRSTIVIYRASNARQRRNTKRATRNTEEIT